MAEEKSDSVSNITNDELRIVIEGTEKKIFVKDKNGVEHRLSPITMGDMIDFEDAIGNSIYEIPNISLKFKHIVYLLYLSLRKEGCNKEDLDRRKYKYTERQVQDMFDLKFMPMATGLFTDILSISGFGKGNPPEPTVQKDTMPVEGPGKA